MLWTAQRVLGLDGNAEYFTKFSPCVSSLCSKLNSLNQRLGGVFSILLTLNPGGPPRQDRA